MRLLAGGCIHGEGPSGSYTGKYNGGWSIIANSGCTHVEFYCAGADSYIFLQVAADITVSPGNCSIGCSTVSYHVIAVSNKLTVGLS